MKKINLKTDKFVVIGAGDTGRSIIAYLKYNGSNILRVLDTRDNPPKIANLDVIGGILNYENIKDATTVIISPGVSIYEPVLQKALSSGIKVIGDIELFAQAIIDWKSKIIGITGSNGKTTVTSLTGYLCEKAGYKTLVAGNIGTPVLEAWLEIEKNKTYPDVIVLELSSFQLETLYSLNYDSSIVLNISEDHLDRYRDLLEYAYVKAHVFNNSQCQILNTDDQLVMAMARHDLKKLYFAETNADFCLVKIDGKTYLQIFGENVLLADDLQLVGKHNYLNVLSSFALLYGAGLLDNTIINLAKSFAGLEHRMQKVAEINGVLYIEDSKGTNVGAVIAGVGGIDRPIHLILGGDGKGQDFYPLRQLVIDKCKSVAVIGQDANLISNVLSGIENVVNFTTLPEAVRFVINNAKSGDAVILSPACASWDMFDNYKHRAQVFVDSIYEILK
ncbi:MAG: UDP-N-acetylmuramoyl-L-alanine--D-glutamate ligase [Burkholderiales bacterium]|nr:UDP-N-acetylmuramoyl-L-alanine--D-glutamate ligase [Burkholderiales bacterium]